MCSSETEGSSRVREQREAWRRFLRPVWSWWSTTRREGRGGHSHYHLGFAPARHHPPPLSPAHNQPPAPHFLTQLINRSSVWLVTIESSRGAGACREVDDLLVSSTDLTSTSLRLCRGARTQSTKGGWVIICETEKHDFDSLRCQARYVNLFSLMLFGLCCQQW